MILQRGYLTKDKNFKKEIEEYKMKLISKDRLDEVMELQYRVYEGLSNKNVLFMDSYKDMLEDLEKGAMIIGVLNSKDELISYRYIGFPGNSSSNLGNDISLDKKELDKVVHLETTVVDPKYRGNRLQYATLKVATEITRKKGYHHQICTVSPQNFYSLYNIMKSGLKIKSLKKKYGTSKDSDDGLWRFILHRDLNEKFSSPIDLIMTKFGDYEEQKSLIENGYIGYEIVKDTQSVNFMKFSE